MKIAIIGLGKMGGQIARKLHDGGHDVIVNDHHAEHIATAVAWGATPANSRADVVAAFDGNPAVIWL
ncbi:MAG: NAD(P)-binding domain-containing protein, partial [Candidatus Nanoperiomorbaceae bacterium]